MTTELAFIESLRALANGPAARNFDDDCAVLEVGGETLLLTHDAMIEGVHFLPGQDPADVAWKLVSVNMSDLASKGAKPVGVLLGYMLGGNDSRFIEGLREVLSHYGAPLLGGDTVSGEGPQALGLTAIGKAAHTPVPSRSGASEGDDLFITGPVGSAMMGFEALQSPKKAADEATAAYRRPHALLAEGQGLAPHVSAMMDISDGLLLDAARMARASGVSFAIERADVPIAAPENRRADALRWGDDYQLLFTAPAGTALPVEAHRIGHAIPASSAPILLDGYALSEAEHLGYEH